MAGAKEIISDDSETELINPDFNKRKDSGPSSYFVAEFNITKKCPDEQEGGSKAGRYFGEEGVSCRKVCVNVNSLGAEKKTEIVVTPGFCGRKKVDSWTQSDRNIEGREECGPRQRKKWVRPPVVGQASSTADLPPAYQQTSSDSELEKNRHHEKSSKLHVSLSKTTRYFDAPPGSSYDQKESYRSRDDPVPTPEDVQRVPSPASASSLTCRPLEWDSGADVGYFNPDQNSDHRLSTIEKLALAQGTASIFKRSDPEGTTESAKPAPPVNIKIAPPVAESTPKEQKSESESESGCRSRVGLRERNAHPLFPEVIVKRVGSERSESPPEVEQPADKRLSLSMEEVAQSSGRPDNLPRSHSHSNIPPDNNRGGGQRGDSAKSRSSSSVSTVVVKRRSQYGRCLEEDGVLADSPQEGPLSPQGALSPQGGFDTLESGPLTGEARVNSFEYLPGHVYENSVAQAQSDSSVGHHSDDRHGDRRTAGRHNDVVGGRHGDAVGGRRIEAPGRHDRALGRHDEAAGRHDDDPPGRSLKEDVERGARLMAELVRSSRACVDEGTKRQLVRRVMERLIRTDYPDDRSPPYPDDRSVGRSPPLTESRGQISGESSTEKSGRNRSSHDSHRRVDKCVGTGISTSLSGYTESSTDSSKRSSSLWPPPRADKMTQVTTSLPHPSHYNQGCKKRVDEGEVVVRLRREKKKELDWIRKEIDELSNLKHLLERHETLKRNLTHLKTNRDLDRERFKRLHPTLRTTTSAPSPTIDCGWTSHHYETEEERRPRKENRAPPPRKCVSEPLPRSTAYTITFHNQEGGKLKRKTRHEDDDVLLSVGELKSAIDEIVNRHRPQPHSSLKECLEKGKPDFLREAESRREILSELAHLRQERQDCRPHIIASAHADLPSSLPPPLAVKRVFSQKNLRKQTERKYRQLQEVKLKKAELKKKEEYRTNRLTAQVFNKKLQKRTLKGEVNLSNSVCVTDPPKS